MKFLVLIFLGSIVTGLRMHHQHREEINTWQDAKNEVVDWTTRFYEQDHWLPSTVSFYYERMTPFCENPTEDGLAEF